MFLVACHDWIFLLKRWGGCLPRTTLTHDLERNKLVFVFLRILEYYEGFLFLTLNCVDNIDPTFELCIHISLRYGDLNFESRRQVWKDLLGKETTFTDSQIDTLATIEIKDAKNVLKVAQLLATGKDSPLNYGHVRTITKLRAANTRGS